MKKILFIAAVFCSSLVTSNAVGQSFLGSGYGNVLDTVTTGSTIYLTSPALVLPNGKNGYTFQLDATNLTGTSTITAILQSSNDGSTWSNHFKVPGTTGVHSDTLSISGTTQHIWNVLPLSATTYGGVTYWTNSGNRLYFRIKLIAGATQTTRVKARNVYQ